MAENSVAPVARGDSFFKGGTADAAGGIHLEGIVHVFPDTDPAEPGGNRRTIGAMSLSFNRLCRVDTQPGV